MATPTRVMFTPAAATKIATAVRAVLKTPIDQRGRYSPTILPQDDPQPYKVASLPAAVSGVVPPYVVANSVNANGSAGTSNTSVGVVQAHSVGDTFYALPVSGIYNSGSALMDSSNKSIGAMEVGNYGQLFTTKLNYSTGAYNVLTPDGATQLAAAVTPQISMLSNFNHSQGSQGICTLSNSGSWIIVIAGEGLNSC